MNNDGENVINTIVGKCSLFLNRVDLQKVERLLIVELHDYEITKRCTELSTVVEDRNLEYIMRFLAIKKVAGLSDKSLKAYSCELRLANEFFSNKPFDKITTNDIRFYLAKEQANKGLSQSYLDTKLRYLKSFYKTLRIEGIVDYDPTERISKIKVGKVIRKPFEEYELELLRKEASKDERLNAIVEFLASTGCRVSEVSSANRNDIKDNKLIITGKGNKQRTVYLTARATLAISDYLATRTDQNEALFVGKKNNSGNTFERLAIGRIEQLMRNLGRKCEVPNCHPHRFRRTTATQALRAGMPIEQVSLMLGHDQLNTTQIYARSTESDIEAAHRKYVR